MRLGRAEPAEFSAGGAKQTSPVKHNILPITDIALAERADPQGQRIRIDYLRMSRR